MTASFREGELYHILVEGDAVSLYYVVEEDSTILGLNRMESPYLEISIEDNKITKLKAYPTTTGVMTPLPLLTPEEIQLEGFNWFDYLRPTGPDDIFRSNERNNAGTTEPRRRRFEREDITL